MQPHAAAGGGRPQAALAGTAAAAARPTDPRPGGALCPGRRTGFLHAARTWPLAASAAGLAAAQALHSQHNAQAGHPDPSTHTYMDVGRRGTSVSRRRLRTYRHLIHDTPHTQPHTYSPPKRPQRRDVGPPTSRRTTDPPPHGNKRLQKHTLHSANPHASNRQLASCWLPPGGCRRARGQGHSHGAMPPPAIQRAIQRSRRARSSEPHARPRARAPLLSSALLGVCQEKLDGGTVRDRRPHGGVDGVVAARAVRWHQLPRKA